ncbi:hypothetical protein FPV67DRAFT_1634143 [Lyophyllum atratum]|nr:hypothetical protein FPV67DRAFT_1634143 [Lyophyllum atratum]
MLLVLLILHFARGTTNAAPFSLLLRDTSTTIEPPTSLAACTCPTTRSIWDIIWSCLATIFACSWASIHPNVPPRHIKWWGMVWRRVEYMIWTVLAPELMILWAMRQYVGAWKLAGQFEGVKLKSWSTTHGHFFQMGGYLLYEGATPRQVLYRATLYDLLNSGSIRMPNITKEEINDRSKSDGVAKCLVIGQTGWFVLQCAERWVEGLVVTELELITAALALLNGFMYFFWWDKPFDVRTPVPVYLIEEPHRVKPELQIDGQLLRCDCYALYSHPSAEHYKFSRGNSGVTLPTFSQQLEKRMKAISLKALCRRMLSTLSFNLEWPLLAIKFTSHRLNDMTGWATTAYYAVAAEDRYVGMFHSVDTDVTSGVMFGACSIIGMIFGAIHCVGWHFVFSTHTELIVWRVCSVTITSIPAVLFIYSVASYISKTTLHNSAGHTVSGIVVNMMEFISIVSVPIYMLTRISLLLVAFLTLRNLPDGAYAAVNWTSRLPHI